MSYIHQIKLLVEFKNTKVTGPMVSQIVGVERQLESGKTKGVIIYCRGFTKDAEARAKSIEKESGIKVDFKVVEE